MTAHMRALHGRVGNVLAAGMRIAHIVGTHHLRDPGINLRYVYRVGLVGRQRIHDPRGLRVCRLG